MIRLSQGRRDKMAGLDKRVASYEAALE
ncbi:succinyl-CoA--3-ketoacid-CoA transferase, partial [Klebsiella pneumoniae]